MKNPNRTMLRWCWPVMALGWLCGGCQIVEPVLEVPGSIIDRWRHPPSEWARDMEDPNYPDKRREGINGLVKYDFGRHGVYLQRYRQIAESDPDFTVRAAAIRALNRSRDAQATPIFIKAMNDDSELVRLEAAKALANVPDAKAAPVLIQHLQPRYVTGRQVRKGSDFGPEQRDESKDVRIAAADALKHYRAIDVARALAAELDQREFAIAWQSRLSLMRLTNKDFGYSETAWLAYLTGPEKPFG